MVEALITIIFIENILFSTLLVSAFKKPKVVIIRSYEDVFKKETQ